MFKKFYDNPKKYNKKFIYNFDNQHDIHINNYLKNEGYSTINNSLMKEIDEQRINNMIYEKKYGFKNWPLLVKIKRMDNQEIVFSNEKQLNTFLKILLKSDKYNFFFDFENLKKILNQLIL
ncbi:hypothetical protein [Spiroplasma endosymbiont of Nebria brevicollis]|uniref:hypothetical protein n=1 Tax=Spiroplasma endosymbiont of Nebria brevicollis TaxID=3066284 RepID=UPI00313B5D09